MYYYRKCKGEGNLYSQLHKLNSDCSYMRMFWCAGYIYGKCSRFRILGSLVYVIKLWKQKFSTIIQSVYQF